MTPAIYEVHYIGVRGRHVVVTLAASEAEAMRKVLETDESARADGMTAQRQLPETVYALRSYPL